MEKDLKMFSLTNKKTFVLGGLGLIGKSIVKVPSEAGSDIVVLDINSDKESNFIQENLTKTNVSFEYFDCSDLQNIEKNIDQVISKYSCPEVFINCSWPRTEDFTSNNYAEVRLESLRKNIDIHLNSYSWMAIALANHMIRSSIKGSIIQFGSIYGLLGQDLSVYVNTEMKENASYSIIKGGIINLTRSMSSFYGKHDIRVNTICPGAVQGHVAGGADEQNKEFIKNFSNKVPLGRLAKAEEMAGPVLFLATDASSYVTGLTLVVDGGWTAI